jgi:DNA-entry nuclease
MKTNIKLVSLLLIISLVLSFIGCSEAAVISLDDIPAYASAPYVEINGGVPYFTDEEITDEAFEEYSPLDPLGRCGVAFACIGTEIMPTEERGDISSVTPTGWEYNGRSNNREYDFGYLYNRCHLIGFQLAGENANELNLITGTVYMNVDGMLPFENEVDDYVEETENHVMYRVTPIYDGYNYVASGVLMEALSVEDDGRGVQFCVYVYNVQPGIEIDYFTGRNRKVGDTSYDEESDAPTTGEITYIVNKKSKKFHYPDKTCANSISEENRLEYHGTREDAIGDGYDPCGTCKP